jgi:hypothetical protein
MAETDNIAKIADIISSEIFETLGWARCGHVNQNWPCCNEAHNLKTHPSDVVFYYEDPYTGRTAYVQTDLKSYADGSITRHKISGALNSLVKQVSCASISPEWQRMFKLKSGAFDVHGMLFVFNHDGKYDKSFERVMDQVVTIDVDIPENSRIFVASPQKIEWLDSVAIDIRNTYASLLGKKRGDYHVSFLHPQLDRTSNKLAIEETSSATLEDISGPFLGVVFRSASESHLHLYVSEVDLLSHEFQYLLDYLRHSNRLAADEAISVIVPPGADGSKPTIEWERANVAYIEAVCSSDTDPLAQWAKRIAFRRLTTQRVILSDVEVGFNYDR